MRFSVSFLENIRGYVSLLPRVQMYLLSFFVTSLANHVMLHTIPYVVAASFLDVDSKVKIHCVSCTFHSKHLKYFSVLLSAQKLTAINLVFYRQKTGVDPWFKLRKSFLSIKLLFYFKVELEFISSLTRVKKHFRARHFRFTVKIFSIANKKEVSPNS